MVSVDEMYHNAANSAEYKEAAAKDKRKKSRNRNSQFIVQNQKNSIQSRNKNSQYINQHKKNSIQNSIQFMRNLNTG